MATWYVDPAAGGANNGTSWADAWTTIASAVNKTGADIIYCRGSETIAATIVLSPTSGGIFIGCNAAGAVDGTRYVINANSAATNCIETTNKQSYTLMNFELKNATSHGIYNNLSSNAGSTVQNVLIHDCGGSGTLDCNIVTFIRCQAYNNAGHGFSTFDGCYYIFCSAYTNGGAGFSVPRGCIFYGCISNNNADSSYNFYTSAANHLFFNNVADGTGQTNETGIYIGGSGIIIGNRITNCATGINFNNSIITYGWNNFFGNTTDKSNTTNTRAVPYKTVTDTNQYGVGADDGYVNAAAHDFNIKTGATLRRTQIDLGY